MTGGWIQRDFSFDTELRLSQPVRLSRHAMLVFGTNMHAAPIIRSDVLNFPALQHLHHMVKRYANTGGNRLV